MYKVFQSHIISIFFYLSPNRTWNFVTKFFRYRSFPIITGHGTENVLLMKFEILGLATRSKLLINTRWTSWLILIRHSVNTLSDTWLTLGWCLAKCQCRFSVNQVLIKCIDFGYQSTLSLGYLENTWSKCFTSQTTSMVHLCLLKKCIEFWLPIFSKAIN